MGAGRSVGTIFAELDLDATSFTRKQKEILTQGEFTAKGIEKAFRTLGTQSDLIFDAQKRNIINAYNAIATNAKSSAAEILRAEQAKHDKIAALNREMQGIAQKTGSAFTTMFGAFSLANIATQALYSLKNALTSVFKDGFQAVEDVRLSTASLASTITSFAKGAGSDLAGTYKQAYDYSSQVVLKMEEWDARTVATGKNLTAMVETLAQGGVVLDVNNKKQEEGFIAIANALALMTQGQNADIQFRQEIRGLIDGEAKATNRLATMLEQQVGGALKDHVQKWKEQGTLIENAGALLTGFAAGAKDIDSTWLAVKSTLETTYHKVLRGMFLPIYEDIVKLGKDISLSMMDQQNQAGDIADILKSGVYKGWVDIKNIVRASLDIVESFQTPLTKIAELTGAIFEGWGYIFSILPTITERLKPIVQSIFDIYFNFSKFVPLWKLYFENWSKAGDTLKEAGKAWSGVGKNVGKSFSGGFLNEVDAALLEYNKKVQGIATGKALPPEMRSVLNPSSEKDAAKAADKAAKARSRLLQEAEKDQREWAKLTESAMKDYEKQIEDEVKQKQHGEEEKRKFLGETMKAEEDARKQQAEWASLTEKAMDDYGDKIKEEVGIREDVNREIEQNEKEKYRNLLKYSDNWKVGIKAALEDIAEDHATWSQEISDLTKETFSNMESAFSNGFYKILKGEFEDLGDVWDSFCDSMLQTFADMLAKMVAEWVASGIKDLFKEDPDGGGGGGGGGSSWWDTIIRLLGNGSDSDSGEPTDDFDPDTGDWWDEIDENLLNYAKGAYKVSDDQVARIHKGEMVIPEEIAEKIRQYLAYRNAIAGINEGPAFGDSVPGGIDVSSPNTSSSSLSYSGSFNWGSMGRAGLVGLLAGGLSGNPITALIAALIASAKNALSQIVKGISVETSDAVSGISGSLDAFISVIADVGDDLSAALSAMGDDITADVVSISADILAAANSFAYAPGYGPYGPGSGAGGLDALPGGFTGYTYGANGEPTGFTIVSGTPSAIDTSSNNFNPGDFNLGSFDPGNPDGGGLSGGVGGGLEGGMSGMQGGFTGGPGDGGYATGIDFVPKDMLAFIHAGEKITPANKNISDINSLAGEIKALREEMKAANFAIAANTGKMARYIDRWDGEGMPADRGY